MNQSSATPNCPNSTTASNRSKHRSYLSLVPKLMLCGSLFLPLHPPDWFKQECQVTSLRQPLEQTFPICAA